MDRTVQVCKRVMDVLGAGVGLAVCAPLLPVIAAAVYLDNPGPILYGQVRVGRTSAEHLDLDHLPTFKMWKFRSMRVDAEKGKAQLASANDDRITRVGKILRKSRLDELPQFWNVLVGDMSIVGPRPERPEVLLPQVARPQLGLERGERGRHRAPGLRRPPAPVTRPVHRGAERGVHDRRVQALGLGGHRLPQRGLRAGRQGERGRERRRAGARDGQPGDHSPTPAASSGQTTPDSGSASPSSRRTWWIFHNVSAASRHST